MNNFQDIRLLLYLFIALRVTLLIVYQPQLLEVDDPDLPVVERGVTLLGDFQEHYGFARQMDSDNLPYRDYWVEFPPVWTGLTALVYGLRDDFTNWASVMYLIMLVFDVGNLLLLQKIGARLHGTEIGFALAWIYALLAAPLIMLAWNFEVIVLFSMLAGLWYFLEDKPQQAGAALALGILTKYIPILLLPLIWRFAVRQKAILMTGLALGLSILVLIPLLIWGGKMALKSLTVQFDKPSYQTVWALVDGNYGTGGFPGGEIRYDENASVFGAGRNAAKIPGWLRLIPFAALGLWLLRQPMPKNDQAQIAFFSVTVILFMLWAQGWSPQWTVILTPLILLNFPSRIGVLIVLALMVGALIEYPLLFRYAAETDNLITGIYKTPFALLILMRTLILSGLAFTLIGRLRTA